MSPARDIAWKRRILIRAGLLNVCKIDPLYAHPKHRNVGWKYPSPRRIPFYTQGKELIHTETNIHINLK